MTKEQVFLLNQMFQNFQIKLKDAGDKLCDKDWTCIDAHFPYDCIGYVKAGTIQMTINGRSETIEEGGMYYLPAMCCFSHWVVGKTARVYWTHFEFGSTIDKPVLNQMVFPVCVRPFPKDRIEHIYEEMFQSRLSEDFGSPLHSIGLMYELTAHFFEFCGKAVNLYSNERFDKMKQIAEYICNHLDQNLTVEQLAEQVGLNPHYFIKVFQNFFQETPVHFVLNRREQAARQLLEYSDMSIKQIGLSIGFTNQNYFSEFFKKRSGYSPSEYRKLKGYCKEKK